VLGFAPIPEAVDAFQHEAFFYDGEGSYLRGTVPFVREGLRAGEPVMVAVSREKIALLSEVLGPEAEAVRFADMTELGGNPARIIPAWREFLDARDGPVRGIGEPIWAGRSAAELVECQLHESLLNLAFADADGFKLLCPYDTTRLDGAVLHEARCSHPVVSTVRHGRELSGEYRGMDAVPDAAAAPLAPPPAGTRALSFEAATLPDVRELVVQWAELGGLDEGKAGDLVLAVHELATSSVYHGGGIGVLRLWSEDGAVVGEVRDSGRIEDALAGRVQPSLDGPCGWALWIANLTCDLVQVRSGMTGTVVRVHMYRD
jgi:anti-sigma regulatory factor (Ser/Thr protein kinase)